MVRRDDFTVYVVDHQIISWRVTIDPRDDQPT